MPDTEQVLSQRIPLCNEPTPLEPMNRLANHLGMPEGSLWVKRDDQTGLALGGNKARKLEYLTYEAVQAGADVLVTGAGPQSNHCRMTAAAANRLGRHCVLVLAGSQPKQPTGNILVYKLLGAEVIWLSDSGEGDIESAIQGQCDRLTAEGRKPFYISVGGSVPTGALGYVRAARELLAQDSSFDAVFVGTGSCGTHAGLVAGLEDFERVVGVRVGERVDLEGRVSELARETAELAGLKPPSGKCRIIHDQIGAGYGALTDSGVEAIELAARLEGLITDPVYTGKTLAGLIAAVRSGLISKKDRTVFLHTGGVPGLFAEKFRDAWDVP